MKKLSTHILEAFDDAMGAGKASYTSKQKQIFNDVQAIVSKELGENIKGQLNKNSFTLIFNSKQTLFDMNVSFEDDSFHGQITYGRNVKQGVTQKIINLIKKKYPKSDIKS